MMERRIIKLMMLCVVALTACYYDSEEDLYPVSNCITTDLSYQQHIAPILQRNCYTCHSAALNTGNVTLEGHNQLMKYVTSGQLEGAINHRPGFQSMPQGAPKMPACDIAKIEAWIDNGAQNN